MSPAGLRVIVGAASLGEPGYWTSERVKQFLDIAKNEGVGEIDTGQIYGESESVLGTNGAGSGFKISTKIPGALYPGSFAREEVVKWTQRSLQKLEVKQIDVLYLHAPDPKIPIEDTLHGIQDLYETGAFRRFGLSNYTVEQVQQVHDHQKQKGWVLPTVFQGNYNAVARTYETLLLPTLRKLGIAFYAYSPAGGGFLSKTKQQVLEGMGRFDEKSGMLGTVYSACYKRPSLLDALDEWQKIAEAAACSSYDLAIRWVCFNSALRPGLGDSIIIGPNEVQKLEKAFAGLKLGPLPSEIVQRVEKIWGSVGHESPLDVISVSREIGILP